MIQYGYLRETQELADKSGLNEDGIIRTGLDSYLKLIFPDVTDWIHDKTTGNKNLGRLRPDYRSETLKMIVEFDGIHHYQNAKQIFLDYQNTEKYKNEGYKVIRIPWFIQLTKSTIKNIFNVKIKNSNVVLLDERISSFSKDCNIEGMCTEGIRRYILDSIKFYKQFYANLLKLHELKVNNRTLITLYKYSKLLYPNFNSILLAIKGIKKSDGGRPKNQSFEDDCVIRSINKLTKIPYIQIKEKLDLLQSFIDNGKYGKRLQKKDLSKGYSFPVIDYYMTYYLGYRYIDFTDIDYFEQIEGPFFTFNFKKALLICPYHCSAYINGWAYELDADNECYFYEIEGIFVKDNDFSGWEFFNAFEKNTFFEI